jgi:putative ABC transport system permease protein
LIQSWLAVAIGSLSAAALAVVVLGLVVSLPAICWLSLRVLSRREWVPLSYNLRSLGQRKVTTAATLLGLSLVVFVLTSVLMIAAGIEHMLESTGDPLNVKVFRKSVWAEGMSWVNEEQLNLLRADERVAQSPQGVPRASPEALVLVWAQYAGMTDPDAGANLSFRGVTELGFELHRPRQFEGREPSPGSDELVIGKGLIGRFAGAALGESMSFAGRSWKVVGVMDQAGSVHDSELWGDIEQVGQTFRRGVVSVTLGLKDADAFSALVDRLAVDPQLNELQARREAEYWRSLGADYAEFVRILGGFVGLIFSFGAVLGAMNTMYSHVAARTRELGTLRAIGFKPRAILISLLTESLLIASLAGVLGVAAASLLQTVQFKMLTVKTLTEMVYRFHLSPALALACLGFAVLMGYAGGLLPAFRASQMRIVDALRAD